MKRFHLSMLVALIATSTLFTATSHALTPEEQAQRIAIKREVFSGLEFQRAAGVAAGTTQPLLAFRVTDSSFINWVIPDGKVGALSDALALPEGFSLAPVQLLEHEPARYYVSLNVYHVAIAGQPGFRAEWSTYVVREGDPAPRFFIIEAQSSIDSFDPVNGPTAATTVVYGATADQIDMQVVADGTDFTAQFQLPERNRRNQVRASVEWSETNDLIYWGNGVADKALYDAALTRGLWTSIDPCTVHIADDTRWAEFINPIPESVLYTDTPLPFALAPMYNLTDPTLPLDPVARATLSAVKAEVYTGLGQLQGFLVSQGQAEALLDFTVATDVPAYFINFEVKKKHADDLAEAIGLPEGLELAKVRFENKGKRKYYISLNLYLAEGVAAGMRAEWSVYVRPTDDSKKGKKGKKDEKAYFMVIDVATSAPSFDVVNLMTPAAEVFENSFEEGQVTTSIDYGNGSFAATFLVPDADAKSLDLDPQWIAANDRVYWSNGVYDKLYYNGTLLSADVVEVKRKSVHVYDETPWAEFVKSRPASVLVFRNKLEYLLHPWFNLEEI